MYGVSQASSCSSACWDWARVLAATSLF